MSFEITCGQCAGQLLVESAGVIVECPLCGAHLSVPEPDSDDSGKSDSLPPVAETTTADSQIMATPVTGTTEVLASETTPAAASPSPAAETQPALPTKTESEASAAPTAESPGTDGDATILADSMAEQVAEVIDESAQAVSAGHQTWLAGEISETAPTLPDTSSGALTDELPVSAEEEQLSEEPTQVIGAAAAMEQAGAAATVAVTPPPSAAAAKPTPAPASPQPPTPAEVVPKRYFIMVAGYASAITLAFLYLLFSSMRTKPHFLESLPDLVPDIRSDGAVGMPRVLPKFNVAPGHELRLGESQRFGNLVVTPVKVTRGPLEFVHTYGKKGVTQDPTEPVLKLWLKFENVSTDQEFPPLDRTLVFRRIYDPKLQRVFSLNFVGPNEKRFEGNGDLHFVYDMPEFSEFELKGQQLDRPLKPGESLTTYVPSEEGIAKINGEWVWRVLFRKGYNPQSGRGVTTLIDVRFTADQVTTDNRSDNGVHTG